MKKFKVSYKAVGTESLITLPDLITADTPQKAIEYAKYYLETSEGKTKDEINKLCFVPMMQDADIEIWLRKIIYRITFLCSHYNINVLFDIKEERPDLDYSISSIKSIIGEYTVLLKRLGYRIEFDIDFDNTCYNAFTIANMKTGEIIFQCDKI